MPKKLESSSLSVVSGDEAAAKRKKVKPMASIWETFNFIFECGFKTRLLFLMGVISAIANGLVYPYLAYLFSHAFTGIAAAQTQGLAEVRRLAYTFMLVGVYALAVSLWQTWCFEVVAYQASQNFRLKVRASD